MHVKRIYVMHKNRKEHGRECRSGKKISDQKHENELKEKHGNNNESESEQKRRKKIRCVFVSLSTHGEICLRYKVWTVYYVVFINNRNYVSRSQCRCISFSLSFRSMLYVQ